MGSIFENMENIQIITNAISWKTIRKQKNIPTNFRYYETMSSQNNTDSKLGLKLAQIR